MPSSDSEEEADVIDDLEFDARSSEAEDEVLEDAVEEASEGDEESAEEYDEEEGEEDEEDEDEDTQTQTVLATQETVMSIQTLPAPGKDPSPELQARSISAEEARHRQLFSLVPRPPYSKSLIIEAICAIAHPEPTHALAASMCFSHIITGSQDGYVRDYDLYTAANGKNFLTQPQRHHCGVVEGTMKSGQLRFWWENPSEPPPPPPTGTYGHGQSQSQSMGDEPALSPVHSLLMQSDALWALGGTEKGNINLWTVRHNPGQLITALRGHRGPVSSMSMQHDEKGFFSAGWDGDVHQWDLNIGQRVRTFNSHGAQIFTVAVRPLSNWVPPPPTPTELNEGHLRGTADRPTGADEDHDDARSDDSFDPLFDDEPDADGDAAEAGGGGINGNGMGNGGANANANAIASAAGSGASASHIKKEASMARPKTGAGVLAPPRGPPQLDPVSYADFSADILLTASIDGQVVLWDRRVHTPGKGVGRLEMSDKTPPWCVSACWSVDGAQVYAGRRNGGIDVWDTRQFGRASAGTPRLLKTLRNPPSGGAVSCVVAIPDGQHIACASNDNIRLWNARDAREPEAAAGGRSKTGVPFKIIPGHHGGQISHMLVDPAGRFLVTSSSNRGSSQGESTRTVLVHEIRHV